MSFTEGSSNKNDVVDVPYHIRDIKGVCIYMGPEEGPVSVYFRSLVGTFYCSVCEGCVDEGFVPVRRDSNEPLWDLPSCVSCTPNCPPPE